MIINKCKIQEYVENLKLEEKSEATIQKYTQVIREFADWLDYRKVSKATALEYKSRLLERMKPNSVNVAIAALNNFFRYFKLNDCELKSEKIQMKIFMPDSMELTKTEYIKLLKAAKSNIRLYYIMQVIACTGIRISELRYVTVEALKSGEAAVTNKGKTRIILLDDKLCGDLKKYASKLGILKGSIFVTRTGKPIDRSYVWRAMKSLCKKSGVSEQKVYPHNLRHLFARTFYAVEKNLVKLAGILGHSSINTTRIYTLESSNMHRYILNKLNLFVQINTMGL